MATVTATRSATTYTLDLSEDEALYVLDALRKVEPAREQFGGSSMGVNDPVYEALSDELLAHATYYGPHAAAL